MDEDFDRDGYNIYAYLDSMDFDFRSWRQLIKYLHVLKLCQQATAINNIDGAIRILDLGCGYCGVAKFLRRSGCNIDYVGVDIHQGRVISDDEKIFYADLRHDKLAFSKPFDLVIALDFVQNLDISYANHYLSEMYDVLKQDGWGHLFFRSDRFRADTDAGHHLRGVDYFRILVELRSVGFQMTNVFGVNYGSDEFAAIDDVKDPLGLLKVFPASFFRSICAMGDLETSKFIGVDFVKGSGSC